MSGPGEPVAEVRDLEIESAAGTIPARLYRPEGDGPLPLVVYLHGGGWMLGSIESFDTVVRALANAAGAIVVSVGYRLAPEAPFPAGLEDAICAVRWLAANAAELGARPASGWRSPATAPAATSPRSSRGGCAARSRCACRC